MKPLLLLVVLGVLGAFSWLWWTAPMPLPPVSESASAPSEVEAPDVVASDRGSREQAAVDEPVAPTVEAAVPTSRTSVASALWTARFLVVDEEDRPVPDAAITVWGAVPGGPPPPTRRHAPMLSTSSDANGRAEAAVTEPMVFAAAVHAVCGESLEVRVPATAASSETRLVLERARILRGHVLRNDGSPSVRARVVAFVATSNRREPVSPPQGVDSDGTGAFALPLRKNVGYDVHADHGDLRTLTERVWVDTSDPPAIVLRFSGALVLRGAVVDASSRPVAGAEVKFWREIDPLDVRDNERGDGRTGDDGRFEISVKRHARYQLIASADGHGNSTPHWVEPTPARPVETVLQLRPMSCIGGRVFGPDSRPLTGVRLSARPEQGQDYSMARPSRTELFGGGVTMTTGVDGGFLLEVHPDSLHTLVVWPTADNHRLDVRRAGIPPGVRGLEIHCTEGELTGCTVHCVVTRSDGAPIGPLHVRLLQFVEENSVQSGELEVRVVDDGFVTPPLSLGVRIGLQVSLGADRREGLTAALAPAFVGPITTEGTHMTLPVRLAEWAELPLLVLDAAGRPATSVGVVLRRDQEVGIYRPSMPVDAGGRAMVRRISPGPASVLVHDAKGRLCEQSLLVMPGLNAEVVIRLPMDTRPR